MPLPNIFILVFLPSPSHGSFPTSARHYQTVMVGDKIISLINQISYTY